MATAQGVLKRGNLNYIDPASVTRVEGWNDRLAMGDIEGLANSIKAELDRNPDGGGLINAIRVQRLAEPVGDKIFGLVDGDRRLTAIELLLSRGTVFPSGIPANIEPVNADSISLMVKKLVANDGLPFSAIEQAMAYKKLRDAGLTIAEIEARTGHSDNTINSALALLEAPEELRDALKAGAVTATMAKQIAVHARGDSAKLAELTKDAVDAGKDKGKKRAVQEKIEEARGAKAAKRGLVLKVKPLSADKLNEAGARAETQLIEALASAGFADDKQLLAECTSDNKLAAAFSLGVVMALKKAAGLKAVLTV